MSDTERGLYSKYNVTKADGTPLDGDCFVLRPDRDPAAAKALLAYADSTPNEELSSDIRVWLASIGADMGTPNQITALRADNERLQQWVNDLQSGMYVNCVYCGHRYGPRKNTPVSMADVLKQHVENCPKHPMATLKAENAKLRETLAEKKA